MADLNGFNPLEITIKCKKREGNGELTSEVNGSVAISESTRAPPAPSNDVILPWKR